MMAEQVSTTYSIFLFRAFGHWNVWFDGMILMFDLQNDPTHSYLRTVVVNLDKQK